MARQPHRPDPIPVPGDLIEPSTEDCPRRPARGVDLPSVVERCVGVTVYMGVNVTGAVPQMIGVSI